MAALLFLLLGGLSRLFLLLFIGVIQNLVYLCCVKHELRYHFVVRNVSRKQTVIHVVKVLKNSLFLIQVYLMFPFDNSLKVLLVFLDMSINPK